MLEKISLKKTLPVDSNLWDALRADMLATGRFRDRFKVPGLLESLHLAGCSEILPDPGVEASRTLIYAHVARLKTGDPHWEEISMAFVHGDYGHNGYLGQVVHRLLGNAPPDLHFYGITKDIAVMKVFRRLGLVPVTQFVEPHIKAWASAVGISKKVLPKTALLEEEPDIDRIYRNAQSQKTARRWLWKQTDSN